MFGLNLPNESLNKSLVFLARDLFGLFDLFFSDISSKKVGFAVCFFDRGHHVAFRLVSLRFQLKPNFTSLPLNNFVIYLIAFSTRQSRLCLLQYVFTLIIKVSPTLAWAPLIVTESQLNIQSI